MPPSDDAAPDAVTELIVRFRRRYVHAVVRKAAVLAGLWVALISAAAWWLLRLPMMRAWSLGATLAAGILGLAGIAWWTRRHWVSEQGAAAQLDRTLGLEERLITAQEFANRPDASSLYPVLVHETATRAQTGQIRMPRALDRTSATIAILLLLVLILPRVTPRVAAPTPDAKQPHPQPAPLSQSEEQRQQQQQQQQQQSQPAQPSPQSSPSSGGGPEQQSPQQGQQGQERGAGEQQGAGQSSGTQDTGKTGEQGQAQQQAGQPQGDGQSSGRQEAGKAGQQQGQRAQSGAQQHANAQQQQGAGNQQSQNQGQGQGQQSAGQQGQAQSMTQQQAGGKQGESQQGAGMSPGQQDAMKADIQKLLKDVSAELKNLQASLEDTNQPRPQAGTSTDPNIYGEAETLPESQGSLPVPIQLETDEAQTSRTRQGSGVGTASERAGRAAPTSKTEAVQLSSEPAQEPPTQHEAVPPDYQGVFDQIRQQPEGTP